MKKVHSVRIDLTSCPGCHVAVDGAGNMEGGRLGPKPDDLCVCVYCLALNQYDAGMQLRAFDYETLGPEDRAQIDKVRAIIRGRISN